MNIASLTTSLRNLLSRNNTTTATLPGTTTSADISANLKSRITGFQVGVTGSHNNIPVPHSALPVVFVEADSVSDDFNQLGRTNRRKILINWNIVGVTGYGIGSADERKARENSDLEILTLSTNIETLLRNYIDLSSTVDWCKISSVNYNGRVLESTYNSAVNIAIQAQVQI